MQNAWAVIPAYNEEKNLPHVLSKAKKIIKNVVVVDDGSRDNTVRIAREAGCIVLHHVLNLGKGATLKTGCDYAVKKGAEYIVVLDADAQHNPEDIPRFLEKLKSHDIVFSYRKPSSSMPLVLKFGNWIISNVIRIIYGISLKDTQSGFRAFTKEAYKKIRWAASDYSMESEMIALAGKHKLKYVQTPIQTIYSDKYKGTTVIDGIKIVFNMMLWRITKRN